MPLLGFEPMTSRSLTECSTNNRSFCDITRFVFVFACSIVILSCCRSTCHHPHLYPSPFTLHLHLHTPTTHMYLYRPLCNWIASGLACKINAGGTVVTWGETSKISMVRRCSQSVPVRPNQRACSWHIADWETEVGLIRALWLWQQSVARHKLQRRKRKWKKNRNQN